MKVELSTQVYQWVGENGGHAVGNRLDVFVSPNAWLMKHWHTGEVMLVQRSELMLYPSSPIPQPGINDGTRVRRGPA